MDLSKAFDSIEHELLIAKLNAYGFSKKTQLMIYNYISGRKQRVKLNGSFSNWRETCTGVPQDSVFGPLVFNVYINDLFLTVTDTAIYNFADDTTIFAADSCLDKVVRLGVRLNGSFSNWRETCTGVPQDSVFGPLLFNVYINDPFLMVTDTAICNFANDTTIFAADSCLDKVLERLETDAVVLSKWFPENFMKLNEGNCHLLTLGLQSNIKIKIGEAIVEESYEKTTRSDIRQKI